MTLANTDAGVFRELGFLGRSRALREACQHIRQAASTDSPVLISGETGTGKDLAAQAVHTLSPRRAGPYIPIHLGAIPKELLGAELFGHERGAFTGAVERRSGKFEQANGGTIFLDEISTIDAQVQVSLLRLLENQRFTRLGGKRSVRADIRIIAATNEDLREMAACGQFRQDLLYRLDVLPVRLPPLRERHGDIPLLVRAFLTKYRRLFSKKVHRIAPECMAALQAYGWPGNVRELKNVIQRAVLMCSELELGIADLPPRFQIAPEQTDYVRFRVGTPLDQIEREMVQRTLAAARNRSHAAELLGISRRALYNKLERYGLL